MPVPTLLVPGSIRGVAGNRADPGETPLGYIQRWIRKRMPEFGGQSRSAADRVLVVRASTGSGKSTVLPVGVFRILRAKETPAKMRYTGPGVLCTQPRVLTAIALANDVSVGHSPWNGDMVLGETVGFQTGPVSDRVASGLTYATVGVLAAQLRHQDDGEVMGKYRVILVDEAHERTLDSDMVLMLLRNFYIRNSGNPRLPFLLLTSATFDPAIYAEYFGVGEDNIVEVSGRAYPITRHWPARGTNDYAASAAAVAIEIHEAGANDPPEQADILIFIPGAAESTSVALALHKANKKYAAAEHDQDDGGGQDGDGQGGDGRRGDRADEEGPSPFLVLEINRDVVVSQIGDYELVFAPPATLPRVGGRQPSRRIIVSTVVAETGITIDTLRYVIDCGWSRTREVYPPWGAEGIITRPAPQSRIHQREGRVGRLFPGEFYPLYTENVYSALDAQQLPEIFAAGPGEIYLPLVREQQRQKHRTGRTPEFRVEDITLLDPPAVLSLVAAAAAAAELGFVSARARLPGRGDAWPAQGPPEPGGRGDPSLAPLAGYGLTPMGHIGALFTRTSMEGARVLLAGYAWGAAASDLACAVAAFGTSRYDLLAARDREADALRATVPHFLLNRAHGGGPAEDPPGPASRRLPPSAKEAAFLRARLILADDFVEVVLAFDAFAWRLDASRGDLAAVAAWCAEVGLNFDALIRLARRRDEVMAEMILAGLDPLRSPARRLSGLAPAEFSAGVVRFKRCLYDGLRGRLLRWCPGHPDGPGYVTLQGLRVRSPPLLTDAMADRLAALQVVAPGGGRDGWRPQWILTDQVRLMPTPKRPEDAAPLLLHVADTNLVSILDGYVSPDPEFGMARGYSAAAPPGEPPAGGATPQRQQQLPGKFEPPEGLAPAVAGARLGAYERVLLAAAGGARAPVLHLDDAQLAALYAPRQLEALLDPLRRAEPCAGRPDAD